MLDAGQLVDRRGVRRLGDRGRRCASSARARRPSRPPPAASEPTDAELALGHPLGGADEAAAAGTASRANTSRAVIDDARSVPATIAASDRASAPSSIQESIGRRDGDPDRDQGERGKERQAPEQTHHVVKATAGPRGRPCRRSCRRATERPTARRPPDRAAASARRSSPLVYSAPVLEPTAGSHPPDRRSAVARGRRVIRPVRRMSTFDAPPRQIAGEGYAGVVYPGPRPGPGSLSCRGRRGSLMPATVIVGLQWGDEGKGKTTDFLAEQTAPRRPLPGRRQRRPHADARRRGVQAPPRPVRHPLSAHRPGHRAGRRRQPGDADRRARRADRARDRRRAGSGRASRRT